MATIIRRARAAEAESLTLIAHAAKRYWQYPERWLEVWREALTVTPDFIRCNEVYVAMDEAQIIGFYALLLADDRATLEHLWIAPAHIGRGFGEKLFKHATERASALGATLLAIEADPHAEGFYQRMGAEKCGEVASLIEAQRRVLPHLVYHLDREF
jgi:GNAT superfamily N-acetyltransferase